MGLERTSMDRVGLFVWNLNAKFLLNSHNNLNSVQAVQTQIVCEMRGRGYLIAL